MPYNPSPENGEAKVLINTNLSWYCSDPDGDNVTYDVCLLYTSDAADELFGVDLGGCRFIKEKSS